VHLTRCEKGGRAAREYICTRVYTPVFVAAAARIPPDKAAGAFKQFFGTPIRGRYSPADNSLPPPLPVANPPPGRRQFRRRGLNKHAVSCRCPRVFDEVARAMRYSSRASSAWKWKWPHARRINKNDKSIHACVLRRRDAPLAVKMSPFRESPRWRRARARAPGLPNLT